MSEFPQTVSVRLHLFPCLHQDNIEEVTMLIRQPGRQGRLCKQLLGWEGDRGPNGHRKVSADEKFPLIHRYSVLWVRVTNHLERHVGREKQGGGAHRGSTLPESL